MIRHHHIDFIQCFPRFKESALTEETTLPVGTLAAVRANAPPNRVVNHSRKTVTIAIP